MNKLAPIDVLPFPTEADILGSPPPAATPVLASPAPAPQPEATPTPAPETPPAPAPTLPEAAPSEKIDLKDWKPGDINLKDKEAAKEVIEKAKPESVTPPVESEGIARLRQSYEESKAAAEQYRVKALELEALKAQQEAEIAALREESSKLQIKASQSDPWQHPDVQAIVGPVNQEISKLPEKIKMGKEELRNFTQPNISALTNEFMSIGAPDSQGYDDRRYEFNERLEDLFPENSTSVRDAIIKSADAAERAIEKMNVLQANGMVQSFQEVKDRHQQQVQQFEQTVEIGMFDVSEEFRQADPYHPMSVIHTMIASSPAVAKISGDIKSLIKKAAIPPAPISPEELDKMTPEARDQVLAQRHQEHVSTIEGLMKIQGPALLAYQLFPAIYKKMVEYQEKLALISSEIPGGKPVSPEQSGPAPKTDIKSWSPPPIPKMGAR